MTLAPAGDLQNNAGASVFIFDQFFCQILLLKFNSQTNLELDKLLLLIKCMLFHLLANTLTDYKHL